MNAANTPTFTTHVSAGFPPAPPEAHQRADIEGKRLQVLDALARQALEMQTQLNSLDEAGDVAVIRTSPGMYFGGDIVAEPVTKALRYTLRNAQSLAPRINDHAGNSGQAVTLVQALKDEIQKNADIAERIVRA